MKGHRVWKRRALTVTEMADLSRAWSEVAKSYGRHTFAIVGDSDSQEITVLTDISWRDLASIFKRAGMWFDWNARYTHWQIVDPPRADAAGLFLATGIEWEEGK